MDVKNLISGLNTFYIDNKEDLENDVQEFANNTNNIWFKHSKLVNITRYSKLWWNEKYQISLETYKNSR